MPRLRLETKKSAASPTSAGSVFRLSGAFSAACFNISVKCAIPRAASVLIGPEEIPFTRIFFAPSSLAKYLRDDSSAAFATPITSYPGITRVDPKYVIAMIDPPSVI